MQILPSSLGSILSSATPPTVPRQYAPRVSTWNEDHTTTRIKPEFVDVKDDHSRQ